MGTCGFYADPWYGAAELMEMDMTEDDVKRIVREELRAAFPERQRVGGLDQIMPVQLPMPPYRYQTPSPNTCGYVGRSGAGYVPD